MLQQTQVARVLEKYPEFLQRFPTVRRLASARQRDVVVAWKGMGYNNRAVRLHRLARMVVENHGGQLPHTCDELMQLPGVGRYTANAVLSSAFGAPVSVVDVNVQRVLSRVFRRMKSTADVIDGNEAWRLADELLPNGRAYHWNQALMDLGATVCTARTPRCGECPLPSLCASGKSIRDEGKRMSRPEPSSNGIPNRIYRGKIVDALRQANGSGNVTVGTLLKAVNVKAGTRWLASLLEGLQRDGVIRIRGGCAVEKRLVSLA